MIKALLRHRTLLLFLALFVALKLFALGAGRVENLYSRGLYPVLSKILRSLFGWIPFSVGDVLYVAALCWLLAKIWKVLLLIRHRQLKAAISWATGARYLTLALGVYLVFNLFWGLNYDRQGIARQVNIGLNPYTRRELLELTLLLQQRLNTCAASVDTARRESYAHTSFLLEGARDAYDKAEASFPFLRYRQPSIKPSLLTPVGRFFGFTGYYNPFTAEAQVKTDIPVFLKPFVVTHEMAHQLGYAKENEANFVAFLACRASGNPDFLYAAYFELYRDALSEYAALAGKDEAERIRHNLAPRVQSDLQELRAYLLRTRNFVEPLMSSFYDRYLRLNNQPRGHATYSEVIAYLVGYQKKYGAAAI